MPTLRGPLTVVIDASSSGPDIGPLLESVRAGLQRGDRVRVLLADEAQLPAARGAHRLRPDELLIGDPGTVDRIGAPEGIVILINGDAVIPNRRSIDELLAVVTAGHEVVVPRSNGAPWPQCPPDPPDADSPRATLREVAQRCSDADEELAGIGTAGGPCIALGPKAAASLTGVPARTAEVRAAVAEKDLRVTLAPGAYIHATAGQPVVSVCLIVKDEAGELADCLQSVKTFADEIVVYDTGSTDDSVEIARAQGAIVIEGEWRRDFAWARNQALRAARGRWVLSIDADERLETDDGATDRLRTALAGELAAERFVIDLFDLQGSVHAPVRSSAATPTARMFRRRHCHWVGALHEQPDARPGLAPARSVSLPGIRFVHRGYLEEYVQQRGKWARNLDVALAATDAVPDDDKECFDLARSLRSVGEYERAFILFDRAAELGQNPVITRAALEFAVLTLCETGRALGAGPYLERLRALPGGAGPARYLEGWVHVRLAEWEDAVRCLDGVTDYDDHFTGFREGSLALGLAIAYNGLGRQAEARAAALDCLLENDQSVEALAVLLQTSSDGAGEDDGSELRAFAASLAPERLVPFFARLNGFPAPARDRVADAVWNERPGDRVVLAVASQLAPALSVDRQFTWSERLRANGLAQLCPLRTLADAADHTAARRAAVLARAVHQLTATDLESDLDRTVAQLQDEELADLLLSALRDCPDAATTIVIAGAVTPARCVGVVGVLEAEGFADEALTVLAHGVSLDASTVRHLLNGRPELRNALRKAAGRTGRHDVDAVLVEAA